jgi:hypothetical protein
VDCPLGNPKIRFASQVAESPGSAIRNSSWKDRKAILPAIKAIYRAESADMAMVRLEAFEAEWGKRYPAIGQAWRAGPGSTWCRSSRLHPASAR